MKGNHWEKTHTWPYQNPLLIQEISQRGIMMDIVADKPLERTVKSFYTVSIYREIHSVGKRASWPSQGMRLVMPAKMRRISEKTVYICFWENAAKVFDKMWREINVWRYFCWVRRNTYMTLSGPVSDLKRSPNSDGFKTFWASPWKGQWSHSTNRDKHIDLHFKLLTSKCYWIIEVMLDELLIRF